LPSGSNAAPPGGAPEGGARASSQIVRHAKEEALIMTAKPLLDEAEARGAIQSPKGWRTVLSKQWSAPILSEGGLTMRKRPAEPLRHWPSPSVTQKGRL
jgi:hypothetical protein